MQASLRPRLYKVLPDEIVASPGSTQEDTDLIQEEPPTHTPRRSTALETREKPTRNDTDLIQDDPPTHRPQRSAALKARKKIAATTYKVSHQMKNKHGWLSEDQNSDDDYPMPFTYAHVEVDSTVSSTPVSDTSTEGPASDAHGSSDSDTPSLSWDTSPEQYRLYEPNQESNPVIPQRPPLLDASRQPLHAKTSRVVSRTNAFRDPPLLPPPAPRKTRIPKPISPSQVRVDEVNDISGALARYPHSSIHQLQPTQTLHT